MAIMIEQHRIDNEIDTKVSEIEKRIEKLEMRI